MPSVVSSIAHFDGHFREANEGGQVDLILDRPVPHEDAVVLASVNDEACGGAVAPSLTAAARAGASVERPGRGNGSAGAEPENVRLEEVLLRYTSHYPFPHVVGNAGSGSWKSAPSHGEVEVMRPRGGNRRRRL
jgi:hypothetical protein